jgi:hypothetical protein
MTDEEALTKREPPFYSGRNPFPSCSVPFDSGRNVSTPVDHNCDTIIGHPVGLIP